MSVIVKIQDVKKYVSINYFNNKDNLSAGDVNNG